MMATDEAGPRRVAWTREPGKWTMSHLTVDGERTLCGMPIPARESVHGLKYDVEAKVCERCAERAREMVSDSG